MLKIAVIGSAGRGEDAARMNMSLYSRMLSRLEKEISDVPLSNQQLVSGGAAWADHLAVTLFLNGKVPRLHLHLPAPWNFVSNAFTDTRDGRTANRLHSRFSDRSLTEIGQALLSGATYDVSDGFKTRNILVGQVDRLIAFTWSHTGSPKLGGGTRHCWDNSLASVKVHIDLGTL